jgi:hypothetical protein
LELAARQGDWGLYRRALPLVDASFARVLGAIEAVIKNEEK